MRNTSKGTPKQDDDPSVLLPKKHWKKEPLSLPFQTTSRFTHNLVAGVSITTKQNNVPTTTTSSSTPPHTRYTGVSTSGERFTAQIYNNIEKKQTYLGTYDTPKEAAHGFDRAVIQHNRPHHLLNFPDANAGLSSSSSSSTSSSSSFPSTSSLTSPSSPSSLTTKTGPLKTKKRKRKKKTQSHATTAAAAATTTSDQQRVDPVNATDPDARINLKFQYCIDGSELEFKAKRSTPLNILLGNMKQRWRIPPTAMLYLDGDSSFTTITELLDTVDQSKFTLSSYRDKLFNVNHVFQVSTTATAAATTATTAGTAAAAATTTATTTSTTSSTATAVVSGRMNQRGPPPSPVVARNTVVPKVVVRGGGRFIGINTTGTSITDLKSNYLKQQPRGTGGNSSNSSSSSSSSSSSTRNTRRKRKQKTNGRGLR